jgi:hypothetical protein
MNIKTMPEMDKIEIKEGWPPTKGLYLKNECSS